MKELRIQLTDELAKEIETAAKACLVTPEHYATCRLSQIFRRTHPNWLPMVAPILENMATAIRGMIASESKPAAEEPEK